MNIVKAYTTTAAAWLLIVCTSFGQVKFDEHLLVGLWEENSPTVHAITLRKSDGTYRRKLIQNYDYAKPYITYQCAGNWKVRGFYYTFDISNVSTKLWEKDVGKTYKEKLQTLEKHTLKYLSTDGAMVEEQKIGNGSDAEFDKAVLKPLVP